MESEGGRESSGGRNGSGGGDGKGEAFWGWGEGMRWCGEVGLCVCGGERVGGWLAGGLGRVGLGIDLTWARGGRAHVCVCGWVGRRREWVGAAFPRQAFVAMLCWHASQEPRCRSQVEEARGLCERMHEHAQGVRGKSPNSEISYRDFK